MSFYWQEIAALAVVGIALIYLGRRVWRALRGESKGGCATGCSTCPAGQDADSPKPLVAADTLLESLPKRQAANGRPS